jgi:hypothetical protein
LVQPIEEDAAVVYTEEVQKVIGVTGNIVRWPTLVVVGESPIDLPWSGTVSRFDRIYFELKPAEWQQIDWGKMDQNVSFRMRYQFGKGWLTLFIIVVD